VSDSGGDLWLLYRQYYDMALSPGIYTIQNVKNRNWAMLLNGNNQGEVVAGSSARTNVGEKVRL
jgi:hypothetical protein